MTAYRPSGPRPTAPRQRDVILRVLREVGSEGVLSTVFLYQHSILRPASQVNELRRQGFLIETVPGPGGIARYVLRAPSRPLEAIAELRGADARDQTRHAAALRGWGGTLMPVRTIGGKALNSGIRGGLWEKKHSDAMGKASSLFGWLVHRQTTERNGTGLVLRGKSLSYAEISADTGWPERTLRRWMARLRLAGYIEVKHSVYCRLVIRILKAKKFNPKQLEFPAAPPCPSRPDVADLSRPDVGDIAARSGRLKEGTEVEQKDLWRGTAIAVPQGSAAQPAAPAAQPKQQASPFAFIGVHLKVSERQDYLLQEGFPWVDRQAEYRKADCWLEANQNRRPKSTGRFLHNWFIKVPSPSNGGKGATTTTLDDIAPIPSEVMGQFR